MGQVRIAAHGAVGGDPKRVPGALALDDRRDHLASRPAGRLEDLGADDGLDEDSDRAAAGESHRPRLLVAHAERDEPGATPLDGGDDFGRRGRFHASTRHRPGYQAVPGGELAASSGRGAEPHTLVTTARPTCRGPAGRRSYAANRSRMTDAPGALTEPQFG